MNVNVHISCHPNGDKHLISPYVIPTCSNIQVTSKGNDHQTCKVLIFVQILPTGPSKKYMENTKENMHINIGA